MDDLCVYSWKIFSIYINSQVFIYWEKKVRNTKKIIKSQKLFFCIINRYFSLILKIIFKKIIFDTIIISEKYSLEIICALKEGSKEDRGGENSHVTPFRMSRRLRLSSRRFSLFHFRSPDFKADSKVERGFKGLVYTLDRSGARIPSLEFYDRVCRETIVPFSTFLSFWRFVFFVPFSNVRLRYTRYLFSFCLSSPSFLFTDRPGS